MQLSKVCTILFLWIGLVSPQDYDTYSFYPSSLYIDSYPNLITTGITLIRCSDDHLYMAVKGIFTRDILMIYYKGAQGYQFLYTVTQPEVVFPSLAQIHLSGSEPFVYLVMYLSDAKLRVFHISRYAAIYKQTLVPPSITYLLENNYRFILTTTTTRTIAYQWDSTTETYSTQLDITDGLSKNSLARAISPDGAYLVVDHGAGTTILYLYDTTSMTAPCSSYDISPILTSNIKQTEVQFDGTGYTVIVLYLDSDNLGVMRLKIAGGLLSFLEQSVPISLPGLSYPYMSRNGNYLANYFYNPLNVSFYQYDSTTLTFNTLFFRNNYAYPLSQGAFFVSDDGIFTAGTKGGYSEPIDTGFLYYKCTVPYCQHCKFIGVCATCNSGFEVNGSICSCPSGQTNLNGTCVTCTVSACLSCNPITTCLICANGYTLDSNSCSCPSPKSVSWISGLCISCNVPNCLRCDYDNACSAYYVGSSSSPSISTNTTTTPTNTTTTPTNTTTTPTTSTAGASDDGIRSMVIFLVVGLILLLLGTSTGLVFLFWKIQQLKKEPEGNEENPQKDTKLNNALKQLKQLNDTCFQIAYNPPEAKIEDFIHEEPAEQETRPTRNTKRRWLKKINDPDMMQQVQIKPKDPQQSELEFKDM